MDSFEDDRWLLRVWRLIREDPRPLLVIHGNVDDLFLCRGRLGSLQEQLESLSREYRQRYVHYDLAHGLTFLDFEVRKEFLEACADLLGLTDVPGQELPEVFSGAGTWLLPTEPVKVLPLLERMLLNVPDSLVVIRHPESLFPAADWSTLNYEERSVLVRLLLWMSESKIWMNQGKVLLPVKNLQELHPSLYALESQSILELAPVPDHEARLQLFPETLVQERGALSGLSSGLTRRDLLHILKNPLHSGEELAHTILTHKKTRLERQVGHFLELISPSHGFESLAGLEVVKSYLKQIVKAIERREHNLVPMGITLMGPPGTGKTALAHALAHECRFACVHLKNIRSKWLGQSEQNFEKVLQAILDLSPVIVVEDEADQSEHTRDEVSGDSGVGNRLRQLRFRFTGDPAIRGKVLWIRISNRPDRLDVADKRSGRSSVRIPICLPDRREAADILALMPQRHGFAAQPEISWRTIAELCERVHGRVLSGADLEEISLRAFEHAFAEDRHDVTTADYQWAIHDFIPLFDEASIRRMEELALAECSSRRFLPSPDGGKAG